MPNVQNTISYENPLKIAQHHNFDNVESFTFYVHTSMYKSEQALLQARILSGDLWIYSRVFLCALFFAQYLNNLLQTSIHHRSCAMKAFWQNFKAEIWKHCERDKGPKKTAHLIQPRFDHWIAFAFSKTNSLLVSFATNHYCLHRLI